MDKKNKRGKGEGSCLHEEARYQTWPTCGSMWKGKKSSFCNHHKNNLWMLNPRANS